MILSSTRASYLVRADFRVSLVCAENDAGNASICSHNRSAIPVVCVTSLLSAFARVGLFRPWILRTRLISTAQASSCAGMVDGDERCWKVPPQKFVAVRMGQADRQVVRPCLANVLTLFVPKIFVSGLVRAGG